VRYHTAVAFKGKFDPSFPSESLNPHRDRIPGRDLASLVAGGLLARGLQASEPVNEEPFFTISCRSGEIDYQILCYLLEPGTDPVWVVECARTLSAIARWRGRSEEVQLGAIVMAIHDTLQKDPRVVDLRWFPELPGSPFEEDLYDTSPASSS
jgi:hypothetical protein